MNATEPDIAHAATVVALAESERALVALARQQDRSAFHKLYKLHVKCVYALCLRLTGNRNMAEDATQEVFLKVWRKLDSFSGDSSFSTWLHAVTTNTTLSYLRKHKSWIQNIKTDWFSNEDSNAEPESDYPAAEPDTDLAPLDQLLPRLPERARVVFVLHAIEGYRHDHIARVMNISTGTSKAHFHRARTLLTQWLDEEL